jgi:hypothetical protein
MRAFKLWNKNRTAYIDLSHGSIITTDVKGLGSAFNNNIETLIGSGVNRRYTADRQTNFESITLKLVFGVNANPYTDYKAFADFIGQWFGQFTLEYDVNDRIVYADVEILNIPKSQKTNFNVIEEDIMFDRITPWYQLIDQSGTTIVVNNTHYMSIFPIVRFETFVEPPLNLDVTPVGKIDPIFRVTSNHMTLGGAFEFDSENRKIIDEQSDGQRLNGYHHLDHEGYAFPVIPPGSYEVHERFKSVPIRVIYKKWVSD